MRSGRVLFDASHNTIIRRESHFLCCTILVYLKQSQKDCEHLKGYNGYKDNENSLSD